MGSGRLAVLATGGLWSWPAAYAVPTASAGSASGSRKSRDPAPHAKAAWRSRNPREAGVQMVEIGVEDARAGPAQAMAREARREGVLAHGGAGQTGLAMDPPQGLSFGPAALHLVVKGAARGDELSAGQPSRMPEAPSKSGSGGGLRTASSSFRSRTAGQALSLSRPASAHPAAALRPRSGSASRASSRPHTRVPTRGPGVGGQSRRSAGS